MNQLSKDQSLINVLLIVSWMRSLLHKALQPIIVLILMTDGTVCDLNQQPRRTRVLYVCYPAGKNEIYSLKEVGDRCGIDGIVITITTRYPPVSMR